MKHARTWLPLLLSICFLGAMALAKAWMRPYVWTVSAAGNGEFLDVPPAIAAARDGDTILILPGSYSGFTVDKELTLLGEGSVTVGRVTVQAAPGPVVLADLSMQSLELLDCSETVAVDSAAMNSWGVQTAAGKFAANVERCADVRLVDLSIDAVGYVDGQGALRIDDSRVELTTSALKGGPGADTECDPLGYLGYAVAGHGGVGLKIQGPSLVHSTLSDVRGRLGGSITSVTSLCYTGYGGLGGDGAQVEDGQLIVVGGLFKGGQGGSAPPGHECGWGGDGVFGYNNNGGTLRYSGATTFIGGQGGGTCANGQGLSIQSAQPSLPDPSLERLSDPVAGQSVTLRVTGKPGAFTRLFLSTQPAVLPTGSFLELLLVKELTISLGNLPPTGSIDHVLDLDPKLTGWPRGTTVYAQTSSSYPGQEHRLSNSLPLVLR